MGACTKTRAFGPAMAIVISVTSLAAALPATAHHGRNEPEATVVWLSSVLRPKGVPTDQPVTICVSGQTLSWTEGRRTYTVAVPDATVSFRPWETISQTWYGGGEWETSAPNDQASGKTFTTGFALPLPAGVPRNVSNLKWRATFESDMPGITLQWSWSATAYSKLASDYNALGIVPAALAGSDAAGTPSAYKRYIVGDDDDDDCDRDHGHHDNGHHYGDHHDHDHHDHGHDHDGDDGSFSVKSATFQASAPLTPYCGGAY
jgi:hypothetical protein